MSKVLSKVFITIFSLTFFLSAKADLPAPFHTPSVSNPPRIIDRPPGVELQLPDGFKVEEYLSGFASPRYMVLGENNEIFLTDTYAGKVYLIKNKVPELVLKRLNRPYGMALHKQWLYVAEATAVKRYVYDASTMQLESQGETIVAMPKFGRGHITRTILFDESGEKFYLSVGSKSNVSTGEPPMRAAVSRFNPDGTGHEIFASGIRNGVGMAWQPVSKQLWMTSHERDGLGDDLVPDYLTSVNEGDFFGWPYAYIGQHEDPRHAGKAPEEVKRSRTPDVLLGGHVGALDVLFYTGDQFPDKYREGSFIALHGSWNRSLRTGYKIVFIPFSQGKPVGDVVDFLTGWMLSPEKKEVWGRPVGLLQMPDGSLLVSDDGAGKLWQISFDRNAGE